MLVKLPPSTVASFLIFLATGGTFFFWSKNIFVDDLMVDRLVWAAVFLNVIYFYVFEAFTEINNDLKTKLEIMGWREWSLRVINQVLVSSLCLLLSISIRYFCLGLIVLYILYIMWDIKTKSTFKTKLLLVGDIIGFLAAILLVVIIFFIRHYPGRYRPENQYFLLGIIDFAYFAIPAIPLFYFLNRKKEVAPMSQISGQGSSGKIVN